MQARTLFPQQKPSFSYKPGPDSGTVVAAMDLPLVKAAKAEAACEPKPLVRQKDVES